MRARRLALVAAVLLTACTSTISGHPGAPRRASSTSAPAGTTPVSQPNSCTTYASPDPNRPRMTLRFTIAPNHHTVHGTEQLTFRPDLPITELIFRLTANTAPTVFEGNKIVVTAATADNGAGKFGFTEANAAASTQGGLLHIPFASTIAAGTSVTAHLAFDLTLGENSFDRFGRAGGFAYFGSGEPLLAWERGFGWHTEDMANFPAESATSEAMDVDLTVVAPRADTVIMSGDPTNPPATGAMRTWHATISTARDVSVAAGPFAVSDTMVDGVRLRLGAPDVATRDALVPEFQRAIRELAKRFGPFPFPSLSVARLPAQGGGIEYPSAILMLDGSRLVAVHETAHQWFYAMVGDSQALHPWLDEAFATYAEELVNDDAPQDGALHAPGRVDSSTASYGHDTGRYYFTTYNKGAAALLAARRSAGAAKWDAAIRCYVARNAWRVVHPSDLRAAIAKLPKGIVVLQNAGALP
ncbi:MAG TPA: M1 family aminopeptidase [Jatrophihabitantaceae bacterium]|nr:M1 family aminopeptidase [Jatrophihabitantaceae bacterium]